MATYTFLRHALNPNSDFETSTGTAAWDNWVESAGVLELSGASAYGGSGKSARVPDGESLYQDITMNDGGDGIRVDYEMDLLMSMQAKPSTGYCDGPFFQLFLYDTSGTADVLAYTYDFHNREWVDSTGSTEAAEPGYWVPLRDTFYTDWTEFALPRIIAPIEAGADVADTWKLRMKVSVSNDAGSGALDIDNWKISYAPRRFTAEQVGRFICLSDGVNYPVKYDLQTTGITELSLHPPYAGDNTLPTTSTTSSGGFLTDSYYYGFLYVFSNGDIAEYSAPPLGVASSSGAFTEQAPASGSNVGKITVDFGSLEIPNAETLKDTNNAEVQFIHLFATRGYALQRAAEDDLFAGLVYYVGSEEADASASIDHTVSDDDLVQRGILSDFSFGPQQIPAPHYSEAHAFRSRLWVAGGRDFINGKITVTRFSNKVTGVVSGGSVPGTDWGRSVERMSLCITSENAQYDIEEYVYPEDDGTSSAEYINITEGARETTGTYNYRIKPKRGRVWFSEEGAPHAFSVSGFLILDGDEGGEVTMIGNAGQNLVACTPEATFAFSYAEYPTEGGQSMQAISRGFGCIAPGSFVEVDGLAYWLSARGPVVCDGASVRLLDSHLRDMFTDPDDQDYIPRRRSTGLAEASAAHHVKDQSIWWSVRTKGKENLILVFNYVYQSWDILKYDHRIDSLATVDDAAGDPRVMIQDEFGYTWKADVGTVDGAGEVNNHGQLKGQVVSASQLALQLSDDQRIFVPAMSKNFPSSPQTGLDGCHVKIVAGTGAGQTRRIDKSSGANIYINEAWTTEPDTTSVWELGGISWNWRFKNADLGQYTRVKRLKYLAVQQPETVTQGRAEVKVYPNRSPLDWAEQEGIAKPVILTGREGRTETGLSDAAGYTLSIELSGDGPENPMEISGLSVTMEQGEQD